MRPLFLAVLLTVLVAAPKICVSQPEGTIRPKVGLVLSGGGARGAAHVGVIKVLDELRIPVDYIAGTSMGALVGGLYASGISASELERIIVEADWQNWLSDRPPRAQRSYRRKADDLGFLVDFDVGINKDGLLFPLGIVQGQNLGLALRRFLLPVATIENFDLLPIPFRAVATDIVSGEEVILDSGDLSTAMRASASTPGMFKPVSINDQVLVDGGVSNNLPVGIAKTMGADVLIVVDVGFPLVDESELNSPLDITSQMLTIFLRARAAEQLQLMTPQDVLITPELDDVGSQSFEQSPEAMRLGEVAARQVISELTKFSLSEAEYALYRQSLRPDYVAAPMIDRMTIDNESRLAPEVLEARLSEYRGTALDIDQLEADIADIYGFDTFETVDYSIVADEYGNELLLQSKIRRWGPNYLRFGFNLEDDFDGTSNYNLAARLTKTEINSKGGEFRADVVVGENPQLAAEFYQPLDYASRWFINPALRIQRQNDGLFTGGRQIARLRSRDSELSFGIGRLFSNWGELRLTLGRSLSGEDVVIGDPSLRSPSSDSTGVSLQFGYDTIDRLAVPRFGTNLSIGWVGVREGFGSKVTADISQLLFLKPLTWGKNTLFNWWEFSSVNTSGDTPLNALELGGLFNLTGYASGELQGQHLAMGRILYYRRLGDRSAPILNTSVYVGASLEVGNVWQDRNAISASNTLSAGSVFVVLDTVIGPLYLAYGAAEGGRRSAYLFLGQTF